MRTDHEEIAHNFILYIVRYAVFCCDIVVCALFLLYMKYFHFGSNTV